MNAKQAKRLRRVIYGATDQRQPRRYSLIRIDKPVQGTPGEFDMRLTLINAPSSLRARYQAAKKIAA